MKKFACLILAFMLLLPSLVACQNRFVGKTLIVYNWADFIDESVLTEFEDIYNEGKTPRNQIRVLHVTSDTPDTLYTKIVGNQEPWHLVINSDYLLGKMLTEDRIQPFDIDKIPNYTNYVSDWSKTQYETIVDNVKDKPKSFDASKNEVYGIGYMWGSMGILYNVESLKAKGDKALAESERIADLFSDWGLMWNPVFKNKVYMKNSIRETSIVGMLKYYNEELATAHETMTPENYNAVLNEKLNSPFVEKKIDGIKDALIDQQTQVSVMYDVDFDKNAMANGSADLDYCWAGDAYYAIQMGAEQDVVLSYGIPDTGTNLFFDGFFLNKDIEDDDLYDAAHQFVNFLCDPEIAMKNMDYIGYASAVAGGDMLMNNAQVWEDALVPNEDGVTYVKDENLIAKSTDTATSNFNYFFTVNGVDLIAKYYEENPTAVLRLNPVQYPKSDELYKLAVVRTFEKAENDSLLVMWGKVKAGEFPWLKFSILLGATIILVATLVIVKVVKRQELA